MKTRKQNILFNFNTNHSSHSLTSSHFLYLPTHHNPHPLLREVKASPGESTKSDPSPSLGRSKVLPSTRPPSHAQSEQGISLQRMGYTKSLDASELDPGTTAIGPIYCPSHSIVTYIQRAQLTSIAPMQDPQLSVQSQ